MADMIAPTVKQFSEALRSLDVPPESVRKFLRAHLDAEFRAATATQLSQAAGYENYGGVNLQYGKLAKRVGEQLRLQETNLGLLTKFIRPGALTNKDWILIMRDEFADALITTNWLS